MGIFILFYSKSAHVPQTIFCHRREAECNACIREDRNHNVKEHEK